MLTNDVLHGTTMLQGIDHCINALLQGKLMSSMLQIFCTDGCILIGQIQLLALRLMGQGIVPTIVAFCQSVLATMVRKGVQTIIILLQQYRPSCILTCIGIYYKWPLKVRHFQYKRVTQ